MLEPIDYIILISWMFISNVITIWLVGRAYKKEILYIGKTIAKDIFNGLKKKLGQQKGGINKGVNAQAPSGFGGILEAVVSNPEVMKMLMEKFLGGSEKK